VKYRNRATGATYECETEKEYSDIVKAHPGIFQRVEESPGVQSVELDEDSKSIVDDALQTKKQKPEGDKR